MSRTGHGRTRSQLCLFASFPLFLFSSLPRFLVTLFALRSSPFRPRHPILAAMLLPLRASTCIGTFHRSIRTPPLRNYTTLFRRPIRYKTSPVTPRTTFPYVTPTTPILLLRLSPAFVFPNVNNNASPHHNQLYSSPPLPGNTSLAQRSHSPIIRLLSELYELVRRYLIEPVMTAERFVHLALLFLPVIVSAPAILFGKRIKERDNERTGTLWWYALLVKQMERAGPTFIKLAQWAASRSDIFPLQLCATLSKLHSQVDPHPFAATRKTIESAFGQPLESVFSEFSSDPMGIGAIAQVYKARLRPDVALQHRDDLILDMADAVPTAENIPSGESSVRLHTSVAVKVLHPYVRETILRDLRIMTFFAHIASVVPSVVWLSLPEEVVKFGEMMQDQLDLRVEAQHLQTFGRNFSDRRTATFPRPVMAFTTRDMLVEEYALGVPLKVFLDAAAIAKKTGGAEGTFDRKIASIGLDSFLHMLIMDNFIHADLHPGNMLIQFYKPSVYHRFRRLLSRLTGRPLIDDSAQAVQRLLAVQHDPDALQNELERVRDEGYHPRVVFLDAGLVTTLNDTNRRNFLALFRAIAEFDGYKAGSLMIERCRTPELVVDGDIFALRMQHLVLDIRQRTFQLSHVKISNVLHTVMAMVRGHHVKLEGDFVNVVISILLLEGIGRQLDPELDLLKSALPILREYGTKDGPRQTLENMKEIPGQAGWWLRMWAVLEAREWLRGNWREYEWMQLCDILCPNI